ncbi:non-ribosomal peptide synthetase, partial [Paenibacillus cucumis (ex Kampfer et al. 2016)]|uniref:non-ribosomal peptide synthetase n=1 Tax=Paenibacillus cucumis (ex Kampfer et al. 2016) TaxID=1776858 RepID=UPI0021ADC554
MELVREVSRNPLFDVMFALQNMEIPTIHHGSPFKSPSIIPTKTAKVDIELQIFELMDFEKKLQLICQYRTDMFRKETIENFIQHYILILGQLVNNPDLVISEIVLVSEGERNRILTQFNKPLEPINPATTISGLFKEQAHINRDRVAVICGTEEVNYRVLDEKSDVLAKYLLRHGAREGQVIGVHADRSVELVVAILAVLKIGCSYLPLDPIYPQERIELMMEECEASFLLTNLHQSAYIPSMYYKIIDLNQSFVEPLNKGAFPSIQTTANSTAYIMYTSGSTGLPKGVMVQHQGVIRLVKNQSYFDFSQKNRILQTGSIAFDAFTFELWGALLNGATLCFTSPENFLDPDKLEAELVSHNINAMFLTTALFHQYAQARPTVFANLKQLIVGGEVLSTFYTEQVRGLFPNLRMIHAYGPTENTTFSTMMDIKKAFDHTIPIGAPIVNSTAYVLDGSLALQPVGVVGEIYVGGLGVAKGYLNRPALNAERFVEDPFYSGQLMYRTGDMARWLSDGTLEFIGRMDGQVKIRGYRVECGEIENTLMNHGDIKTVCVFVHEEQGKKRLCAYFSAVQDLMDMELREFLSQSLPEYMIPSAFVQLESLPLTPNGKVDKRALPVPQIGVGKGSKYREPQSEKEKIVAKIWADVLAQQEVGLTDNFFLMGGDSIKALQVCSRLNHVNLDLTLADIFQHPTIESVIPYVIHREHQIDQGVVVGEGLLTPIQGWFFEGPLKGTNRFNQTVAIYRSEGFEATLLKKVLIRLVEHHDALRMIFFKDSKTNSWRQRNQEVKSDQFLFSVFTIEHGIHVSEFVKKESEKLQESINVNSGPVVAAGLFKTAEGDHLTLAIHHLVIDGVSWRILLEDLAVGYKQALEGQEICFEQKTDSYLSWAKAINEFVESGDFASEASYWKDIDSIQTISLPKKVHVDNQLLMAGCCNVQLTFSPQETELLLYKANQAYKTEINDLLLTALGSALRQMTHAINFRIDLEGHGREEIIKNMNVKRTIGWFTSRYPVQLIVHSNDYGALIKQTKDQLRQVPNKGIGYGILNHQLNNKGNYDKSSTISFNYLGQFSPDVSNEQIFEYSIHGTGISVDSQSQQVYELDLNSFIVNNSLCLNITYHEALFDEEVISEFIMYYSRSLRDIIDHCVSQANNHYARSKIASDRITMHDADILQELFPESVEDAYGLTPMQEGMLFHSLKDRTSLQYVEQFSLSFEGRLNIGLFKESFCNLIDRHAILRSVFVTDHVLKPLQVVLISRSPIINVEDFTRLNADEIHESTEQYLREDRIRSFNMQEDSLMRLSILQIGPETNRVVWTFHHILMDGWCVSILLKELLAIYESKINRTKLQLETPPSFSSYINWLEKQDKKAAERYWSQYLINYNSPAGLAKQADSTRQGAQSQKEFVYTLDRKLSSRMRTTAQECQVTLNTLFQCVWGIVLQSYNHTEDVVFGTVISGRPKEVPGIERMIGLFINTVPVRINWGKKQTFSNLLKAVQLDRINSEEYQFFPLYELQANTSLKQNLFDHIIVFENYPMEEEIDRSGTKVSPNLQIRCDSIFEQTSYDLTLLVLPGEELQLLVKYNSFLYEYSSLIRVFEQFEHLLQQVCNQPDLKPSQIKFISESMPDDECKNSHIDMCTVPTEITVHKLFEQQVERTPNSAAVVCGNLKITYHQLNARSNTLAHALRTKGVGIDHFVGVMIDRSIEMVISFLAVLKAGGAYLPIDTAYPMDRVSFILKDSNVQILIATRNTCIPESYTGQIVYLDDESANHSSHLNLHQTSVPTDLLYCIYTSGTTGNPKGVAMEHRNIISLMTFQKEKTSINHSSVLQFASSSFDVSIQEILTALLFGGTLVVADDQIKQDLVSLVEYIYANQVKTLFLPTAFFKMLINEADIYEKLLSIVEHLVIAGEQLVLTERFIDSAKRNKVQLHNHYGPSETHVVATYTMAKSTDFLLVPPLGAPIFNADLYIIDHAGRILTQGMPGELYIGGSSVARGYVNRPE